MGLKWTVMLVFVKQYGNNSQLVLRQSTIQTTLIVTYLVLPSTAKVSNKKMSECQTKAGNQECLNV